MAWGLSLNKRVTRRFTLKRVEMARCSQLFKSCKSKTAGERVRMCTQDIIFDWVMQLKAIVSRCQQFKVKLNSTSQPFLRRHNSIYRVKQSRVTIRSKCSCRSHSWLTKRWERWARSWCSWVMKKRYLRGVDSDSIRKYRYMGLKMNTPQMPKLRLASGRVISDLAFSKAKQIYLWA